MKKILYLTTLFFLLHATVFAQETTTIEGFGKTCTEARNDALRNAINKAYGSVVYSKTEINNDVLISDDISMLTSGNVLNYEGIKTCSENNGQWSITLKVTVSQTELKKFIEGKGKSVSISGELLKQKSDQEVASTKAELVIIQNLLLQLKSLTIDPFDYEISIAQVTITDGKYCNLPAEITIKTNINIYNIYLKLIKEIEKITINKTDQIFRSQTLKESNYHLQLNSTDYYLRNKTSIDQINMFYNKILSKLDDYIVVDGCLKELYLKENNKLNKFENGLFFPEPGFVAKTISGNYTVTIEEIGSLDRINIFASHKLLEYKKGRSLSGELALMKYSETNPLEFQGLKNNLLKTFNDLAREKEDGKINLNYNISFSNEGFNKSSFGDIKVSQQNYKPIIETSISQIKLNPSKLCGKFTTTLDDINLNFKWETYTSRFAYQKGKESTYSSYFKNQNLPYGTYILTVKEKELNNNRFKDIYISNIRTRGPFTAICSVILPGWGTRRVTYNEKKGWGRFSLVAAPLTLSLTSKFISNFYYNKYMNATTQIDIDTYFDLANKRNKSSMIIGAVGAAFYMYDIVWVFGKGFKNGLNNKKIKEKINKSEFQIQNQLIN